MKYDTNNIFAKILKGEIPCKKIYENEYVLSFYDINPQRKIHALVIPKGSYVDLDDFLINGKEKVLLSQEKKTDNSMTALQLKSKKWYNLRIQEQILASENKKIFLEKENSQIQKKIAQKHHKMKNSLEKAAFHKKIDEENLDKKNQNSLPTLNKGSDN